MIQLPSKQQQQATRQPALVGTKNVKTAQQHPSSAQNEPNNSDEISAVPLLRVMRLQKPELHISKTTCALPIPQSSMIVNRQSHLLLESTSSCILQSSLCLPDSLTVYVGETFTAHLGVLNTPAKAAQFQTDSPIQYPTIRKLTVVAQLQTPSQRYPLPSPLEPQSQQHSIAHPNSAGGIDVPPFCGIDTIVSRKMEEPGPHILRVEVGYYSPPNLQHYQTFRKFYRFNVKLPLLITEQSTIRNSDTSCCVNMQIEYPLSQEANEKQDPLFISNVNFVTSCDELTATHIRMGDESIESKETANTLAKTALHYFDKEENTTTISPGGKVSYIFNVRTNSSNASVRGIAVGDVLGQLQLMWQKAMGEHGVLSSHSSPMVHCPAAGTTKFIPNQHISNELTKTKESHFVAYRSGLSVDVAAKAAVATAVSASLLRNSSMLMVTVEPVDPPSNMTLYKPVVVPLLIVNHGRSPCTVQVQFNIPNKHNGVVVSGSSHVNIGTIDSHGGSKLVTEFTFVPVQTGLLTIQHCSIMDVVSGQTHAQPPLWNAFCSA